MSTIHLVYPAGSQPGTPWAIGRKLIESLGRHHRIIHHEWDALGFVSPGPDDVLLGHPHPSPFSIFRMSSRLSGWRRIVVLSPYSDGDPGRVAFLDGCVRRSDAYLAITGHYWMQRVGLGRFAHWLPRMEQVDLAIDQSDYPRIKNQFSAPNQRRFLYIGHFLPYKNPSYLSQIARLMPDTHFAFAGPGKHLAGLQCLGVQDFRTEAARALVASYDFLLTVGNSDANPTTILEAMSWGLIPVCTPQSGYDNEPGVVNVPLDAPEAAVRVLRGLQQAPDNQLRALVATNDHRLGSHFTWPRFCSQVLRAVEGTGRRPLGSESPGHRARMFVSQFSGELSPLRRDNIVSMVRAAGRTARKRFAQRPPSALG